MSLFTSFFDKLKPHNYSIVTALVVGIITAVYLLIIMPNNARAEDANNLAVFMGIEVQLKGYIDDKLQAVSSEQMNSIKKEHSKLFRENSKYYIDKIELVSLKSLNSISKALLLKRRIYFKTDDAKSIDSFSIKNDVQFDLKEFIKRINSSSNFKSFFICPITVSDKKSENEQTNPKQSTGTQNTSPEKNKNEQSNASKCFASEALISENVNLKDEDSLCFYNRNSIPISFKESSIRYYKDQIRIPDTDFTLFFAAGISSSYFQSNVNYIKPNHLIFGLLLTGILFLSIFLIKPVVMSYKELLSQMDLIRVVFSIGALTAILVIFGMVGFWKTAVSNRNKSDLKQLVTHIDNSFAHQINTLQGWRDNLIKADTVSNPKLSFKKLYLDIDSNITLINKDSLKSKKSFDSIIKKENRQSEIKVLNTKRFDTSEIKQLKLLDVYFWMNKDGLLTESLSTDNISFPRKFNDRNYFKLLQNKEINTVLTGVFSRERDEYQWIYAVKDLKNKDYDTPEKYAIKGIAFRDDFAKKIKLPPDTDFMLVDRRGAVLAQHSPTKKLYQNVLTGSNYNLVLESILAGCRINNFRMDYQGKTYQVYAKKLNVATDLPVYILGIRDLSYLDYLSQFTFINAFLFVLAYGLLIVLLILVYSSLLYSGHKSFFSREHFYHLFHDYSRKEEYINLFYLNCFCLLLAFVVFLVFLPVTALYFCLLIGFNITFINVIVLNSRGDMFKSKRLILFVWIFLLCFVLPLVLLLFDLLYISIISIIASHIGIIIFYIKKNTIRNTDSDLVEKAVHRKVYLKFITSVLMNHFVMFPFILVCAFYSNEINDYARYYCSPSQPVISKEVSMKTKAYGCDCISKDSISSNSGLYIGSNNESFIHKLNFGFEEPTASEIRNYTIKDLKKIFYIKTHVIFLELGSALVYLVLGVVLIIFLAYSLLNYYSNRFFFFDLMQISYASYYPINKSVLTARQNLINLVFDAEIKNDFVVKTSNDNALIKKNESEIFYQKRGDEIKKAFALDGNNEILPFLKNEFILNSNLIWFNEDYKKIWESIVNEHQQNVLYDFAQDHFSNYKNKSILMELMDLSIINHNEKNGRLQIKSESFRRYVVLKSKEDEKFVEQFKDESKNGTFDKFRLPILIIAISLLVLLMYLNKDSYDKVVIFGSSIGSAILLMNKFLEFGKN